MDQKLEELLKNTIENGAEIEQFLYTSNGRGSSKYNLFSGDYDKLEEVPLMMYKITTAEDKKPVLATDGLLTCVGVVGYDPNRKVAFLSHSDDFTCAFGYRTHQGLVKENSHIRSIYRDLQEMGGEFNLDVKLITGSFPDNEIISVTERSLKNPPSRITLNSLERIDLKEIGSIAIDARTGELFTYDSQLNPNP